MPNVRSSGALPAILIAPHTIWAHYIGTLWECTICCSRCAGITSYRLSALCAYRCPVSFPTTGNCLYISSTETLLGICNIVILHICDPILGVASMSACGICSIICCSTASVSAFGYFVILLHGSGSSRFTGLLCRCTCRLRLSTIRLCSCTRCRCGSCCCKGCCRPSRSCRWCCCSWCCCRCACCLWANIRLRRCTCLPLILNRLLRGLHPLFIDLRIFCKLTVCLQLFILSIGQPEPSHILLYLGFLRLQLS